MIRCTLSLFTTLMLTASTFGQQAAFITSRVGDLPKGTPAEFTQKLLASRLAPELHAVRCLNGEFQGFHREATAASTYRAVVVAANLTPPGHQHDLQFFQFEACPAGFRLPANRPLPRLQLCYLAGAAPSAEQVAKAGFRISVVDEHPQAVDLGRHGGTITVQPIQGGITKARVEALLQLKGVRYIAPVYPAEKIQAPGKPEPIAVMPKVMLETGYQPNGSREPNDPYFVQNRLWGLQQMRAPQAWGRITNASSIIVAVMDSGLDYDHVELRDNLWVNERERNGQPGRDNDGNGYRNDLHGIGVGPAFGTASDPDGHGTHCAGIIGAQGDNARGIVGVCWQTKLMGVRFIGSGVSAAAALKYAVDHGAAVINCSWTQFGFYDPGLQAAIDYAKDKNALVVVAAANNGSDNDRVPNYPASYPNENILTVGAITQNDQRASFSNYGATSVHLFAPGVGIWSTYPQQRLTAQDGTSMAAPHVSGACALLWAERGRQTSWQEIRRAILENTRPVAALRGLCLSGGSLDLAFMNERETPPGTGSPSGPGVLLLADVLREPIAAQDYPPFKFTLKQPTWVMVQGSWDYTTPPGSEDPTIRLQSGEQVWPGSTRTLRTGANVVSIQSLQKLDAGTHELRLMVTNPDGVLLRSGHLSVIGYAAPANSTPKR